MWWHCHGLEAQPDTLGLLTLEPPRHALPLSCPRLAGERVAGAAQRAPAKVPGAETLHLPATAHIALVHHPACQAWLRRGLDARRD